MIEQLHYDDDAILGLLGRAGEEPHLDSCAACRGKLEAYRLIEDALRDEDVWAERMGDDTRAAATLDFLRGFADQIADEDAMAERWVSELLAQRREAWDHTLAMHPEWRTAGMVRKLIEAGSRALDTMPSDAVEITRLAVQVAEELEPTAYASDTVARLRGTAYRDRAYALFYVGRHVEARAAVVAADAALRMCVVDEYDRARLGIVQSLVDKSLDEVAPALAQSRASAAVFDAFGDEERYVSAKMAEGIALTEAERHHEALEIYLGLSKHFAADDASDAHGRVLGNVGYTYSMQGRFDEAIPYMLASAEIHAARGNKVEAMRIECAIAEILVSQGRLDQAAARYLDLRDRLDALGMFGLSANAALGLAEIRLLQGQPSAVPALCTQAMDSFTRAGVAYTSRALKAIAFMREAAEARRATPELTRIVRDYVRRLPAEPALLFLPPDDLRA